MSTLSSSSTRVSHHARIGSGAAGLALARLGPVARAAAPATARHWRSLGTEHRSLAQLHPSSSTRGTAGNDWRLSVVPTMR